MGNTVASFADLRSVYFPAAAAQNVTSYTGWKTRITTRLVYCNRNDACLYNPTQMYFRKGSHSDGVSCNQKCFTHPTMGGPPGKHCWPYLQDSSFCLALAETWTDLATYLDDNGKLPDESSSDESSSSNFCATLRQKLEWMRQKGGCV